MAPNKLDGPMKIYPVMATTRTKDTLSACASCIISEPYGEQYYGEIKKAGGGVI